MDLVERRAIQIFPRSETDRLDPTNVWHAYELSTRQHLPQGQGLNAIGSRRRSERRGVTSTDNSMQASERWTEQTQYCSRPVCCMPLADSSPSI